MGTRSCKATAVRILFGLLVVLGEWCTPSLAPGQTLSRVSSASGSEARQTGEQLRAAAEQAERMRNWETAFTLYCQLYLIDRTAPDLLASSSPVSSSSRSPLPPIRPGIGSGRSAPIAGGGYGQSAHNLRES
jgi:hypothetical protein